MLELIPVLDLMNGIAVSGKSGNREEYLPLKSIYSQFPNPVSIAQSLKLNGANSIYIADLDSIDSKGNNLDLVKQVNMILPVILDWGVDSFDKFKLGLEFASKIIVATESLNNLEELHRIYDSFPSDRIVLSVDIKNNELYSKNMDITLERFKKELYHIDIGDIILLDISKVGTGTGINKNIIKQFNDFKNNIIIAGGLSQSDISQLPSLGIKKALVGTALHNGSLNLL